MGNNKCFLNCLNMLNKSNDRQLLEVAKYKYATFYLIANYDYTL